MALLDLMNRMTLWHLRRQGFRSQTFDTSVSKVHYFEGQGEGQHAPIVMLHGIGSSAAGYADLMVRMKASVKKISAIDAPGHGMSTIPTQPFDADVIFQGVSEWLNDHIEEPSILYGNSLGGGMAVRYALEAPEKVKALVLSSPAGAPMAENIESLKQKFRIKNRKDARAFMEDLYHKMPWYSWLFEGFIIQMMGREHIQQFFDVTGDEHSFSPEQLQSLEMPILFMWGESEKLLPQSNLTYYKEHLPSHAIVERPPRFGHSPHIERPRSIAKRVSSFLSTV